MESWKEISAYLSRDVKTCRRWEQTLDLPIRRLDGTPRARVFAYKDELDFWLEDKLNHREITTTKYLHVAKKRAKKPWLVLAAGLVLIIVAAIALRLIPLPTPLSPGPGKPYLAVLPIRNFTGDESLGNLREILTNLFVIDLCQSRYIKVLPEERMNTILERIEKLGTDTYTTKDLKKIASQEGISHFLVGSATKFGESIRLNLSVLEAGTWKSTWAKDENGTAQDLLSMVDMLTAALKPHLNLTNEQIAADYDEKIENVTTPSMPALRFYLEAKEAFNKTEWSLAVSLFERAVALDPDFAMAYRMLAGVYNHLGLQFRRQNDWDKMREFSKKAHEAAQRRPPSEREKLIIEGTSQRDVVAEMEIFKKLLDLYPDDDYGNYRLGARYVQGGNYDKAEEHLKRIVGVTNSWASFSWLRDVYLDQGRYGEADELLEAGLERFPKNWFFYEWMAKLNVLRRAFTEALLWCEKGVEIEPIQFRDSLMKGKVLFFADDFQAAEEEFRSCLESENKEARFNAALLLAHLYKTQGRFDEAFKQAETTKQMFAGVERLNFDPVNRELALSQAKNGHIAESLKLAEDIRNQPTQFKTQAEIFFTARMWREAEELLGKVEKDLQTITQVDEILYFARNGVETDWVKKHRYALSVLKIRTALEQGRYLEAVAEVEKAKSIYPGINLVPADLVEYSGTAFYRLGDWKSARKEYDGITRMTYGRQEFGDLYAKSYYMLAKIDERLGKKRDARNNYERFLELWKNADSGIPEVDDARARLAALQ